MTSRQSSHSCGLHSNAALEILARLTLYLPCFAFRLRQTAVSSELTVLIDDLLRKALAHEISRGRSWWERAEAQRQIH